MANPSLSRKGSIRIKEPVPHRPQPRSDGALCSWRHQHAGPELPLLKSSPASAKGSLQIRRRCLEQANHWFNLLRSGVSPERPRDDVQQQHGDRNAIGWNVRLWKVTRNFTEAAFALPQDEVAEPSEDQRRRHRRDRVSEHPDVRAEPLVPHERDMLRRVSAGSPRPGRTAFQADQGGGDKIAVGGAGDRQITAVAEGAGAEVGGHGGRVTLSAGRRAWE